VRPPGSRHFTQHNVRRTAPALQAPHQPPSATQAGRPDNALLRPLGDGGGLSRLARESTSRPPPPPGATAGS